MSTSPSVSADDEAHGAVSGRRRGLADRAAWAVTEILAPWVIVMSLPLAVAFAAAASPLSALGWGLTVALSSSIVPMAVIVAGARRGRWDGHHVRNRAGRAVPFAALLGCSGLGLIVLAATGAPWPVTVLQLVMISQLVLTGLITAWWKVSMHAAVACGAVVVLAHTFGPAFWLLAVIAVLIAWSRVRLGDHTPAQVAVGAGLATIVTSGLYMLLL